MSSETPYRMPRAIPAPNIGALAKPPARGSRLWRFLDLFSSANVWLYRRTGGRVGGRMGQAPVLLLHHLGRKSGQPRVTPVLFLADGSRLVIVGSKGGASTNPAWVHNLKAQPVTSVEVARRAFRVRARETSGAERASYWPRLLSIYPSFETYEKRTDRILPVFVLEPTEGEPVGPASVLPPT